MRKAALVAAAVLGGLLIYNGMVAVPVALARSDESGITMVAYRRWLIDPTTPVIDLWRLDGDKSMADVDRNLFKAAEALKGSSFDWVQLSYRGSPRFKIDGPKFKEVGEQWRGQSIGYLVSAIPESAYDMDGNHAFGTWSGGWLGVMVKQLEDHNQLHWTWYLASLSGADPQSRMRGATSSGGL